MINELSTPQRVVVALGGNALQPPDAHDHQSQQEAIRQTARQLADLIQAGYELVITHGNGPQVGDILLREEAAGPQAATLDTCGAMTQGQIGYWLQQAIGNELRSRGIHKPVVTIVTQTIVDPNDPAFQDPSKPIGPFYPDEATARAAAAQRHFTVKEDAGRGWRRVVASPQPVDFAERQVIDQAVSNGTIVIASGGGGVPVVQKGSALTGVDAVIDKDFAATKLAELVHAQTLLILTAVDAATINYRTPQETPLRDTTTQELEHYISQEQFAPGSMLPKVQAAVNFTRSGANRTAIITSLNKATAALQGNAGTCVRIAENS